MSAKQTHEARQAERQRKAGTLRVKPGFRKTRQEAEDWFRSLAPEPVQASSQGILRDGDRPGDRKDSA